MLDKEMINRVKIVKNKLKFASIQDFANFVGVTRSTVSVVDLGKREPSKEYIKAIVTKCRVNAHWLLTGEGEMFISENDNKISEDNADYLTKTTNIVFSGYIGDTKEAKRDKLEIPLSFLSDHYQNYEIYQINTQEYYPFYQFGDILLIHQSQDLKKLDNCNIILIYNKEVKIFKIEIKKKQGFILLKSISDSESLIYPIASSSDLQIVGKIVKLIRNF